MDTARRDDQRRQLLHRLEVAVDELRGSDAWQRYLAVQARFHRYSPRNVLLIGIQRPDATQVAGYTTWSTLGRQVRRGERAISILAPMLVADEGHEDRVVRGFRWVSVFDVAQTDGEPLPSPVSLLEGDDAGLVVGLERAAASLGIAVERGALPVGVNGELRWSESRIILNECNEARQQAKTLAHELGHALLHRHEPDRTRAEVEAESVAFVVLGSLGIDSTPYAAGYLASWLGEAGDATDALRRSCEAIQRAAARIIELSGFDEPSQCAANRAEGTPRVAQGSAEV